MAEINNLEDIKVNFEKITNLINSMRAQGVLNFSGVDKVLTAINTKLDNINFEENTDLIKLLIGEVKNNIEERHGYVVSKFAEIESSVNTLIRDNEDTLNTQEIKQLFDVIATNLAVFSKEVISQKDALSEITLRLESLRTDDTNKNDIIKNISTLKFDIAKINNGFESIILNINNNFGELATSFERLTESNLNDKYGNSIEDIHSTSNTILSAIQMLDRKNSELNEGLERLITVGDFNETKEIILDLVTKQDDMRSAIASIADRDSVNNLSGIVSSSINAINELRSIVIDNSDERSRNIISRLDNLEDIVKESTDKFDFKQFKSDLHGIINDIGKETNIVCNDLLETNKDLKRILNAVNLADFNTNLEKINTSITENQSNLKNIIEQASEKVTNEHRDYINAVINNFNFQMNELNDKFTVLAGEINPNANEHINKIINDIELLSNTAHGITNKIDSVNSQTIESFNRSLEEVKQNIESLNSTLDNNSRKTTEDIIEKLNGIFSTTSDLKTELLLMSENNVQKISSNIQNLSEVINNLTANMHNMPAEFNESIEGKLSAFDYQLKELANNLGSNTSNQSELILDNIKEIYTHLDSLSVDIKQAYSSDSVSIKNNISELYNRINELNSDIPTILLQNAGKVSEEVSTIQAKIEHTNNYLDKISLKLDDKSSSNDTLEKIDAINSDIKLVLENINTTFNDNYSVLFNKAEEINNDIKNLSGALIENVGSNHADLNNKLSTIIETVETIMTTVSTNIKNSAPEEIQSKLEILSKDIKNTINESNSNLNDSHELWLRKLDNISNDAFEVQNSILTSLQGINIEIGEKINHLSNDIQTQVSGVSSNIEVQTSSINEKLDNVSKDVQNVTDKLANYFINNDSDISSKLNTISEQIGLSTNNSNDKMESIDDKSTNIIEKVEALDAKIQNVSGQLDIGFGNSNVNVDSKIQNISELISNAETNTISHLNNLEENSAGLTEKLDNVSKDVQNVTDKLANYFINNDSDLSSKIQNISEQISTSTNTTKENITSLENKSNEIIEKLEAANSEIVSKADTINYELNNKSGVLNEKLDTISSEIKNVTGEIVNHFLTEKDNSTAQSDNINKNIDYTRGQILERVESHTEKLSDEFNNLKDGLNTITDRIEGVKKVSDNTDVLITKLDNITTDVKSLTEELINQISQDEDDKNAKYRILNDNINYAKQELSEQIVEGNKTTSNEISQLFENLENSKTELNQNIAANAASIGRAIGDIDIAKSEIIENNNIGLQNTQEALTSTIHSSEYEIKQQLESLTEKVNESKTEIVSQVQSSFVINENLESLKYEVKAINENINETVENIKSTSELNAQGIHSNINSTGEHVVNKISENISETSNKLSEQLEETKNTIKDSILEFSNGNNNEIIEIVNRIVLALDKKDDFVSDKTDELFSRIKDSIANFQANVEFSNRVLIDSVKNDNEEVKNTIDSLPNKLESTGNDIIQQIEAISQNSEEKSLELLDIVNDLKVLLNENSQNINDNINSKYEAILNDITNLLEAKSSKSIAHITENVTELKSILNSIVSSNEESQSVRETQTAQLNNILEAIGNIFNTITESDNTILDKFETEYQDLKSLINQLNDSAASNKRTLSETIYNRVGSIETLLSKIEAKQDANKTEIYDRLLESIDNIKIIAEDSDLKISESISKMQDVQGQSLEILNKTQETIDNKLFEIKDASNQFYSNIEQNIDSLKSILISRADWDEKFNDMEGALINLSRDLGILSNQSPNHNDIDALQIELDNIRTEFKESLSEASLEKNETITSELTKCFENINELIQSITNRQIETLKADNKLNTDLIIENIDSIKPEIEKINTIIKENGLNNTESISSVKSLLKNVTATFDNVESNINNSIQEKTDSLAAQMETLLNSVKLLDENLDEDTTRQLSIIQDELTAITSALFTNTDKLTLASKLHFDEVYEKFDEVLELINTLQTEQEKISSTNIEKISDSFNTLNNLFEECDSVKALLANLDKTLTKHNESITEKLEETSSQSLVEQCINKVELIENKLDSLDFATRNSEEAGKIIISNIEALEQRMASIQDNVVLLTQNTLSEEINDVKDIITTQSNQIKTLIQETSAQEQVDVCINKVDIVDSKLDKLEFASKNSEDADKVIISNIELIEQKIEAIEGSVESIADNTSLTNGLREIKELINSQKEQMKVLSTIEDIKNLPAIDDIDTTIQTRTSELLESFNKTFAENSTKEIIAAQLKELKSDILAQTVTILDQISFEIEQGEIMDYVQENTNTLKAFITNAKNELISNANLNKEELLNTLVSKDDLSSELDYVNKKLDDLSDTYELQKGFEDVHSKLDYIADNAIKKELSEVKSQLETVANNDELQKEFEEVKKHLLTIQSGDSKADYTYSLQDVESDIAKLRIAMKELQDITPDEELDNLTKKVEEIVMVVDSIKHQISQAEIDEIGANVEKMNEDIVSISSRTNKLILTSENSANMLKENIDSFKLVIDDMDERTRALAENNDLSDVHESISNIQQTLTENANHTQIVNQSLIAIAEWVDCAGDTLTSISSKINKLQDIDDVKAMIRSIEMPQQFDYSVFDTIEEKFNAQQDKIDNLEEKINRLTELVEANDNSQINKKITSVDRQLAKLNKSIERLTSYVDEE